MIRNKLIEILTGAFIVGPLGHWMADEKRPLRPLAECFDLRLFVDRMWLIGINRSVLFGSSFVAIEIGYQSALKIRKWSRRERQP